MAKESSFDVVSVVDMQELDNACQQAARELTQRYDLKGTGASLELSKKEGSLKIEAPSEFVCGQVRDILSSKLAKRGIDLSSIKWGDVEAAGGMTVRQHGTVIQGIDTDTAKKISKEIRDLKVKAKPVVEGDKLRVTSASRDVLQSVIAHLKAQDFGQPLQFTNYR